MDNMETQPESHGKIAISSLVGLVQMRDSGDDWTGMTSWHERRKRQNRLSQRAHTEATKRFLQATKAPLNDFVRVALEPALGKAQLKEWEENGTEGTIPSRRSLRVHRASVGEQDFGIARILLAARRHIWLQNYCDPAPFT
ncbi:unnamed protein product [Clonostachys byssicola]|uniref:Uncharacterized protein n=1 Tax=Clonostachys byssicola TaxID=160290 RepID=A0A9N9UK87_9HYPO|nr:unnamed protein product [Clonostachys byssicola]